MSVQSGQTISRAFALRDPYTAAASNADALPTGALIVNGVVQGMTVTVVSLGTAGLYKATVTLPTLVADDQVELSRTAVVNGVVDVVIFYRDSCAAAVDLSSVATAASLSTLQTAVTSVKGKTDSLAFTVAGQVNANALNGQVALTNDASAALVLSIQAGIINESDGQAVLDAIVTKINSTNVDLAGLSTTTIAAAVWGYVLANISTAGTAATSLASASSKAASLTFNGTNVVAQLATSGTLPADVVTAINADATQTAARTAAVSAASNSLTILNRTTGNGANPITVQVRDGNGAAITGASIQLIRQGGSERYGSGVLTPSDGNLTFGVEAGTYTAVAAKPYYSGAPQTVSVPSSSTVLVTLTAPSFPVPPSNLTTIAYGYTRSPQGDALASQDVYFELLSTATKGVYTRADFSTVSGTDGLLNVPLLKNSRYRSRVGTGQAWTVFTTGTADTYELPAEIGRLA